MVCCCLCCPIFRCALGFCLLELCVSSYIWFHSFDHLVKTFEALQLKDILFSLFLSAWLITLLTSTVTLLAGERKKNAMFILPRIIQLTGLLICGFLWAALLCIYFTGGSARINAFIIDTYELIYGSEVLNADEAKLMYGSDGVNGKGYVDLSRKEMSNELHYYFLASIIIDFLLICYAGFALALTRKYQKEMERQYGPGSDGSAQRTHNFQPLAAPPPPYNPQYKA